MIVAKNVLAMKALVITLAILFLPVVGWADHPSVIMKSAIPIDKNSYRAEAGIQFSRHSAVEQNRLISFSFLYGLMHNMEIGAELPYLFATGMPHHNDNDVDQTAPLHSDRLGDLSLLANVRFLKGRGAEPISMAGAIKLKLPTASRNSVTDTTGEADIGLSLIASKEIYPYNLYMNLSHTYTGNPPFTERPDWRNYVLGMEYASARPNLSFTGEIFGEDYTGVSEDEWSIAGGVSYGILPVMKINSALAIGLSEHAADFGINLHVRYDYIR